VTGKECQLSGHIISNLNGWIVFLTYWRLPVYDLFLAIKSFW
jgi:hypothetical protein